MTATAAPATTSTSRAANSAASQPLSRRRERDAAVARRLVKAERQAAPPGPDEVDLHHHGHRPGEALVDAEQEVGGDDPAPARGHGDQQRNRQGGRPAGDQEPAPPDPLGEGAGAEVGERLGQPEGDDEGEDRARRGETEVFAPISGSVERSRPTIAPTKALTATSSANCGGVLAQAQPNRDRLTRPLRAAGRCGWRRRSPPAARAPAGYPRAARRRTPPRSRSCSAGLWRRSKPMVEIGLAESPRPQTEPE